MKMALKRVERPQSRKRTTTIGKAKSENRGGAGRWHTDEDQRLGRIAVGRNAGLFELLLHLNSERQSEHWDIFAGDGDGCF